MRMKQTNNPLITGICALAMMLLAQPVHAQNEIEYGIFDHLGAGVSLGTDGIGLDVAAPLTDYVAFRAGVSFMPKIKIKKKDIHLKDNDPDIEDHVDVEGKLNIFDFKLLADFYPFKSSSFHITAGAFIGSEDAVHAVNTSKILKYEKDYGQKGIGLGNYWLTTDEKGYVHADLKVNSFKPYIGFGFGRAVPRKSRVSVSCDFGVKFWGKPGLGAMTKDFKHTVGNNSMESYRKFSYDDLDENDDEDLKDAFKIIEKVIVYPVLNVRISGRIF